VPSVPSVDALADQTVRCETRQHGLHGDRIAPSGFTDAQILLDFGITSMGFGSRLLTSEVEVRELIWLCRRFSVPLFIPKPPLCPDS